MNEWYEMGREEARDALSKGETILKAHEDFPTPMESTAWLNGALDEIKSWNADVEVSVTAKGAALTISRPSPH